MRPQLRGTLDEGDPNRCYEWLHGYIGTLFSDARRAQRRPVAAHCETSSRLHRPTPLRPGKYGPCRLYDIGFGSKGDVCEWGHVRPRRLSKKDKKPGGKPGGSSRTSSQHLRKLRDSRESVGCRSSNPGFRKTSDRGRMGHICVRQLNSQFAAGLAA